MYRQGNCPLGRYLTITIDVHPDYGGQTRALLMRNRIFAKQGANADVLMVWPNERPRTGRREICANGACCAMGSTC